MIVMETKRLLIRRFCETDLDDFYEYAKNPNVGPNAGWMPHQNKEISRIVLNNFITDSEIFAIVDKDSRKVIGSVGLHKDSRRSNPRAVMLGYVLSEPFWGREIMVEACEEVIRYAFLNLHYELISIYYYDFNTRSKRVIEKLGFHFEGILREASITNKGICDEYSYSLTIKEWIDRKTAYLSQNKEELCQ